MGNSALAPLTENLNSDDKDSNTCKRVVKRVMLVPGQAFDMCIYCYDSAFSKTDTINSHSKFMNEKMEKTSHYNSSLASAMDSNHMGYSSIVPKKNNLSLEMPEIISPTEESLDNSPTGNKQRAKREESNDSELNTPMSATFLSTEDSDTSFSEKPSSEFSLLNLKNSSQIDDDQTRAWAKMALEWKDEILAIFDKGPQGFEQTFVDKKNLNGARCWFKSYLKEPSRISVTFLEFVANCTPEQYILYANNPDEQKSVGKNIEHYKTIRRFGVTENTIFTVYYMAYQKVLTVSSRDFVYLSMYTKVDDNTWVNAVKSIEHDEYPEFPERTRGHMLMTGTLMKRETDPSNGKTVTRIFMYGDVDSKTNVPDFMSKTFVTQTLKGYAESTMKQFP